MGGRGGRGREVGGGEGGRDKEIRKQEKGLVARKELAIGV
jgi:hypothetical protein